MGNNLKLLSEKKSYLLFVSGVSIRELGSKTL